MIKLIFRYEELKKLYEDKNYRHRKMPYEIQVGYARKCRILEFMNSVQDLRGMKGLHYEKYGDNHSIRINQQRRIIFSEDNVGNITIIEVIDANNHYKKNF